MAKQRKKLSDIIKDASKDVSRVDFYDNHNKEDDQSIRDCILDMEHIIESNVPDGKSIIDFNGGYIQQLSLSRQMYLYYGNDKNNNKVTTIVELKTFAEYIYIRDIFDIYMFYLRESKSISRKSITRRIK